MNQTEAESAVPINQSAAVEPADAKPMVYYARHGEGELALRFVGEWRMARGNALPSTDRLLAMLQDSAQPVRRLRLELGHLEGWDSALIVVLLHFVQKSRELQIEYAWHAAPEGAVRMVDMALERLAEAPKAPVTVKPPFWESVGLQARAMAGSAEDFFGFLGEVTLSLLRWTRGKAYFRPADFLEALSEAGPRALPIVTLISFLVGLILAFVGSMQLQEFGAQIYVANLVGVAMAREMGAMMTAIIMAGRTGASYAARLGTMQVNEEVDALRTTGIEPMDFLTLPRVLAMLVMMPFLCVYSNAIGVLGGMAIGVYMLDLSAVGYWHQTLDAIKMTDFAAGMIKGIVFAFVVAVAGCYHGLSCGRSSAAVGKVTTAAVVSAIVFIIITDSILTVVYDIIDF